MKGRLTEESVLFISVLKWFLLATGVGVIVGLSTTLFIKVLQWSSLYAEKFSLYFIFLPIALFVSAVLVRYLAPDAEGHGTEKVIEAVHKRSGRIKPEVVPVKLAATVVTVAIGGSVGKEGPCAQIGAGLSSLIADLLRLDDYDRKKMVICGISAGFASVFGTPIAGAIFGIEVLFVGGMLYEVLLPSFISGVTAYQISANLGIEYFNHPVNFVPVFSESFFLKVVLAGIFFGICSFLMVETLNMGKRVVGKIKVWPPLLGLIGGALLVILTFAFSRSYLGLGLNSIRDTLAGKETVWYAFLMKMAFTSITLNFGGSGGIVTPIFFVGASSGALFGQILGLDVGTFAAIGVVAVVAGACNTPIAASIMAVEMFGPAIGPYAAVACVISFLMTGHRSVYPSQILAIKKSSSFLVKTGEIVENTRVEFNLSETGIVSRIMRIARAVWETVKMGGRPRRP